LFYALETRNWMVSKRINAAQAKSDAELNGSWMPESYAHDDHQHTKCPEHTTGWNVPRAHHYRLKENDSAIVVTDPNAAEAKSYQAMTKYLLDKYSEYRKLSRKYKRGTAKYLSFASLAKKYKAKYWKYSELLSKSRRASMERRQSRQLDKMNDEMTPQEEITKYDTVSEDNATASETVPEDKTTADETDTEDIATAGEMPKELEETEDTETKLDAETPQVTTADEAVAEDTTNTGEVPNELEEVEGPTKTALYAKRHFEGPSISLSTDTEKITTAGEMPKELKETKDTDTNLDAETPQVTTADEAATEDTTNTGEAPKKLEELKGPKPVLMSRFKRLVSRLR